MPDYDNTDRGALFTRDKKGNEKAPDMGGEFEFSQELVTHLVDCIKAGQPAKIDVSAWRQTAKNGKTYMSCALQKPFKSRQPKKVDPWDDAADEVSEIAFP